MEAIVEEAGRFARNRPKRSGARTLMKHRSSARTVCEEFRAIGVDVWNTDLHQLALKQVRKLVRAWVDRMHERDCDLDVADLSPKTLSALYSFLSALWGWSGRDREIRPLAHMVDDERDIKMQPWATRDESWEAAGLDWREVRDALAVTQPRAAFIVWVGAVLGLRIREAVRFNPIEDIYDDLALQPDIQGPPLTGFGVVVRRGTKGGAIRQFQVTDPHWQRELVKLREAWREFRKLGGHQNDPRADHLGGDMPSDRVIERVHYLLRERGISRDGKWGVTFHGLRKEFVMNKAIWLRLEVPLRPGAVANPVSGEARKMRESQLIQMVGHRDPSKLYAYYGKPATVAVRSGKLSEARTNELFARLAAGESTAQVARAMGVHQRTVQRRWAERRAKQNKRLGVVPNGGDQIECTGQLGSGPGVA
jgi:integrase